MTCCLSRRAHCTSRRHAAAGGYDRSLLGIIHLNDTVKPGLRNRFAQLLAAWAVRTVMITGDNPTYRRHSAAESGVDELLSRAPRRHRSWM